MSHRLRTLKSEPFPEQVRVINQLTEQNLAIFEQLRSLFEERSESSIFHVQISDDRHKVVRAALLALVFADMGMVPDRAEREPFIRDLEEVCSFFKIDFDDVCVMHDYTALIEKFLNQRTDESSLTLD